MLSIVLWVGYAKQHSFDFLDPIHLVMGILLICFCGVLAYDPSVHLTVFADTNRALTLSIVATLAFALGYTAVNRAPRSSIPRWRRALLGRIPRPEAPALLLTLWFLTFIFRLLYSYRHGYSVVSNGPGAPVTNFANMIESVGKLGRYFVFSALIIWVSRSRRVGGIQIWLSLGCIGLEVWITLVAGWKYGPILLAVGMLLVSRARAARGKRLGVGTVCAACGCLMLFLVVFYALDTHRSQSTVARASISTLSGTVRETDSGNVQRSVKRFIQRIGYGGYLADMVGVVDSGVVERQNGATLWPGFLWFVPRALWPAKPRLSIGGWYAVRVLGWGEGPEAAVTLPGDFYLNFGVAGVFAGMLAYGLLLRVFYDHLILSGHTVLGLCLFMPIFLTFALTVERNLSSITGEAGLLFCALSAVLFALTTRPRIANPGQRTSRKANAFLDSACTGAG